MPQNWGAWTPLYHGVDWLSATVPFSAVPYPAQMGPYPTINLVRVRMDDPHVTTYSTPASGLNPNGVKLRQFLQTAFETQNQSAVQGVVGINANYFDYPAPRNTIYGLAVSNLETVSSNPLQGGYYPLLITKSNRAVIGNKNEPRQADTWTAVSGNVLLLHDGRPAVPSPQVDAPHPIVAARTAVGVSYDPDYLYLMTVDGLETNDFSAPYYGASYFDVAMLLMLAGATEAVNLDGGGSTTMGRFDSRGFVAMNVPYGDDTNPNVERAVGNCFAVIARAA
jgi:hypothetical protein